MKKVKGPLGDLEKKLKRECHSAEKSKRWGFLKSIVLQNIETNEGETLWLNPKSFKEPSHCPEKKSE